MPVAGLMSAHMEMNGRRRDHLEGEPEVVAGGAISPGNDGDYGCARRRTNRPGRGASGDAEEDVVPGFDLSVPLHVPATVTLGVGPLSAKLADIKMTQAVNDELLPVFTSGGSL